MSGWVRVERNIYKRGPVYAVRWRSDGRRQYGTVDTLTEARDLRARVEGRKAAGQSTDYSRRRETLADWWPRYESSRAANRKTTRDRDASLWRNHLEPALGNAQVGAIRAADIEDLQEDLLASELAPATVSKTVTLLSSVLDLAVRDQVLDTNPARLVRRVRVDSPEARFLELSQVADLEAAMDPWWQMTVPFMVTTALRIGEVAAVRVSDVNLLAGSVRVSAGSAGPGGVRGKTKTTAGGRTVPTLPRDLCDQLARMIAERGLAPSGQLFTGPDGGILTTGNFRKRVWRPAVAKAGLEGVTPHALRHTAISIWLAQGVEPFRVARWAGHSSTAFLQKTYGHLMPDAEADRRRDELGALLDQARASQKTATIRRLS